MQGFHDSPTWFLWLLLWNHCAKGWYSSVKGHDAQRNPIAPVALMLCHSFDARGRALMHGYQLPPLCWCSSCQADGKPLLRRPKAADAGESPCQGGTGIGRGRMWVGGRQDLGRFGKRPRSCTLNPLGRPQFEPHGVLGSI